MSRFWAGLAGLAVLLALASAAQAAGPAVTFAPPTFVSKTLAGGEPLVMSDPRTGTLVYTSHEGTTHLYGPGFFSPVGVPDDPRGSPGDGIETISESGVPSVR